MESCQLTFHCPIICKTLKINWSIQKQLSAPLIDKVVSAVESVIANTIQKYIILVWTNETKCHYTSLDCSPGILQLQEKFQDTKGVIRSSKSKKDRRTNNDLQSITQKSKDRATRTSLKTGRELRFSGRVSSFCSTCGTRNVTSVTNMVINHESGKDQIVITTKWLTKS